MVDAQIDEGPYAKIVILGGTEVGKTTLAERFSSEAFSEGTKRTIAVEFHTKVFQLEKKQIKLQIWDFGGQAHYDKMGVFEKFCKGASGALICFDLGDLDTIKDVPRWISYLPIGTPSILVGTKYDTAEGDNSYSEIVKATIKKYGLKGFFKTSDKDIPSILSLFTELLNVAVGNFGDS